MRRFPRARACLGAGAWTEGSLRGPPHGTRSTQGRAGHVQLVWDALNRNPVKFLWCRMWIGGYTSQEPWVSVGSLRLTGCFLSLKSGDTDA